MKDSDVMTAKEAAEYLRVSQFTLSRMDKDLRPGRTPGGHRRYRRSWLNKYMRNSRRKKRP